MQSVWIDSSESFVSKINHSKFQYGPDPNPFFAVRAPPAAPRLDFVALWVNVSALMKHYDFSKHFHALHDKAVSLYAEGRRGAETFFSADELAFLSANGITAQNMYDYAEDCNNYDGQPGCDIALGIELVRRDYFLNVQGGKPPPVVLDADKMPAKTDAVDGIEWLPRLMPKARAKLRGELPASLMYCCGGDRRFFMQHDILPQEFLSLIWRAGDDDRAIIDWVAARGRAGK